MIKKIIVILISIITIILILPALFMTDTATETASVKETPKIIEVAELTDYPEIYINSHRFINDLQYVIASLSKTPLEIETKDLQSGKIEQGIQVTAKVKNTKINLHLTYDTNDGSLVSAVLKDGDVFNESDDFYQVLIALFYASEFNFSDTDIEEIVKIVENDETDINMNGWHITDKVFMKTMSFEKI